jgi:hypothetical protein
MSDRLAVPAEEIRTVIEAAANLVVPYYSTLPDRPVLAPSTSHAILEFLHEPPQWSSEFLRLRYIARYADHGCREHDRSCT